MYCKRCGSGDHFTGRCNVMLSVAPWIKLLRETIDKGNARMAAHAGRMADSALNRDGVTSVKEKLTPAPSVKEKLTPGEPCPTCGRKVKMTAAQHQRAYRKRKGGA